MEQSRISIPSGASERDIPNVPRPPGVVRSQQAFKSGDLPLMNGLARRGKVLR